MASDDSDPDAEYALSRLLQKGTVVEYQNESEMLISRVMGKSDSLLTTIYISGLKPALQHALLWSNPTILGEAFSLARVAEARFANQEPTTTNATPDVKPPTSPIITIGKNMELSRKKVKVMMMVLSGVQDASTFEELKHRLSTTSVLSLSDFNDVFFIEADASANVIGMESLKEPMAIHDWRAKKIMGSWSKECFSRRHLEGKVVSKE
nr:reverse transcriptase [Tanacetum cinerariifolium]